MSTNLSKLVDAIIDGDVHRYSEIVRRFDSRVRHIIERRLNDPAAIEDVVQVTFYRAFTNLDRLADAEQLEHWLCVIAKNSVIDHLRAVERRRQKELDAARHTAPLQSSQLASESFQLEWIWLEVDQLTAQSSQILRLRYLRRMSYREIAEQLKLPESTIRGRIFEARKALKSRIIKRGLFP